MRAATAIRPIGTSGFEQSVRAAEPFQRNPVCLRHPVAIEGVVRRGRMLGRTLGFPTANVAVPADRLCDLGVYAGYLRLEDGRCFPGVASVGTNPTTGTVLPRLEFHVFDFDEDLYGVFVRAELVASIRDERRFCSLEELKLHIRADAGCARTILDAMEAGAGCTEELTIMNSPC